MNLENSDNDSTNEEPQMIFSKIYKIFSQQFNFDLKKFVMAPCINQNEFYKCTLIRNRSGFKRFYPEYTFNMDESNKTFLL
jgi:hypothetical protein